MKIKFMNLFLLSMMLAVTVESDDEAKARELINDIRNKLGGVREKG
jgi:hypothetical protein